MIETFANVRKAVGAGYPDGAKQPVQISELDALCRRAAQAWPVKLASVGARIDRRTAMLSGPSFTSEDYPWPSCAGLWLEPVLQIDLAVMSQIGGVRLGVGWLQLWMDDGVGLVRLIPAEAVANAPLTHPPSSNPASYYKRMRNDDESASIPSWIDDAHSIVGWDEPFLDYSTNEILFAIAMVEEELSPPSALCGSVFALKQAIEADPYSHYFPHRAFGAVNESDLEACSVPPVLFVLDETCPLRESANGNDGVYVCYEHEQKDGAKFSVRGWHL